MNLTFCIDSYFLPNSGSSSLKVRAARFGAQGIIIGIPKIKSRLFWTNLQNSFVYFRLHYFTPINLLFPRLKPRFQRLKIHIKEQAAENDVDKVDHDQIDRRFFAQPPIVKP